MIKSMKCFESNDFCKKEKNIRCENYQCGTFYCSIDEISCQNLILWTKLMNKYCKESSNVYTKFSLSIKNCKKIVNKKVWSNRLKIG